MEKWPKMSKSRGNVVTIDEVVYGIYKLPHEYGFRDRTGKLVDFKKVGVWRDTDGYRTSTRDGNRPVFLHEKDNPVPGMMGSRLQHPNDFEYWSALLEKYEEV